MKRITGIDPSGSTLDRTVMCPASAALPQIFEESGRDDDAKAKGSAVHAFLDRCAKVGRAAALAEVDEKHRDRCALINTAKLADRLSLSTEIAFAYNWREDTARRITPVAPRVYEIDPDSEIPATADVAAYDPKAGRAYVGDYKGPRAWLPKPEQSMQLGVIGVSIALIFAADEAHLEYIRIRDDGEPVRFDATLDVFGLAGARARIRETMEIVDATREAWDAGRVPNVTEGPWCGYCPAKAHCPAKTAHMRAVMTNPDSLRVTFRDPMTPDIATAFYARIQAAKEAIKIAEGGMYAYAKTTPVYVRDEPDGSVRMFGELSRPGSDRVDGAIAHAVISELHGGAAANKAVTMEITKSAIGDVARAHVEAKTKENPDEAPTIKATTEKILSAIKERNGITNPTTTTTTEYTISAAGEMKARKRTKAA